jgi:hypothetical protein
MAIASEGPRTSTGAVGVIAYGYLQLVFGGIAAFVGEIGHV